MPDFVLGDEFAKVLTETTMSLVCVLDKDARILFFNDACERVTGFSRGEVVGCDARDFVIPPEEAETFKEVLDYIWSTGLSSPQVGHWLTKDGKRKLIAWSNRLMPSENGGPALLVTSGTDLNAFYLVNESGFDRTPPHEAIVKGFEILREGSSLRRKHSNQRSVGCLHYGRPA